MIEASINVPQASNSADAIPHLELMKVPTGTLLSKFGSGGHKPGSGSAAALLALISCKLIQTVVALSNGRAEYAGVKDQLTLANQDIVKEVEPSLADAFQKDSVLFDRVIQARRKRDALPSGSKERKAAAETALEELRAATELPLKIAEKSLELAEKGLTVFQLGFQGARGDSGVAVSSALAAAQGSLAIVFLNLTRFRGGEWAVAQRKAAEQLQRRTTEIQGRYIDALGQLYKEVLKAENSEREPTLPPKTIP